MRAVESCTCLVRRAALRVRVPMLRLETTKACSQVSSPWTFTTGRPLQPRTLTKTQAGQSCCAARAHRARALQRRKRLRASILAIALTAASLRHNCKAVLARIGSIFRAALTMHCKILVACVSLVSALRAPSSEEQTYRKTRKKKN